MDESPASKASEATEASRQLMRLAREIADVYVAELRPRAMIITGSPTEGVSDRWSDLDLIAFYDELPAEEAIAGARAAVGGGELLVIHPWNGDFFGESFPVRSVECQVGHVTIHEQERENDKVLRDLDTESPHQKAMDGLQHCVVVHGQDLIDAWRRQLDDYPDGLRRAMVERNLTFFPLWVTSHRMAVRDATVWHFQMLVEACMHLLGVLSGLNRVYFTSFQFKRMHTFTARLAISPPALADRIDGLFAAERDVAGLELERLVEETVALVERELPDVDTSRVRHWLGLRPEPWDLSPSRADTPAAPVPPAP